MTTMRCGFGLWLGAGLLTLCAMPAIADDFAIDFNWQGIERCTTTPPEIALMNVPDGTAQLEVKLVDLDFTAFNHGGGTVPYDGKDTIAEADYETSNYRGPCPPGNTHTYEFTVHALGADGEKLATGVANSDFPPRR